MERLFNNRADKIGDDHRRAWDGALGDLLCQAPGEKDSTIRILASFAYGASRPAKRRHARVRLIQGFLNV